jgi:hypothetical protein
MKPIKQTRLSNPEGTVHGNCFTACVAALLDMEVDQVPDMQEGDGKWFDPFWETITAHGLKFEGHRNRFRHNADGSLAAEDPGFFEELANYPGVDGYVIVAGPSLREYVTRGHSVIYRYGKLAHDPHPSGAGLKDVTDFYLITRAAATP